MKVATSRIECDPEQDQTRNFQHENGCTEYEKAVDCELQCEIPMPYSGSGLGCLTT